MLSPQLPLPDTTRQTLLGAPLSVTLPVKTLSKILLSLAWNSSHAPVSPPGGSSLPSPPKRVTTFPVAQLPLAPKNLRPSSELPVASFTATLPSKTFAVADSLRMRPLCRPAGSDAGSVCERSLPCDVLFRYRTHFTPSPARMPFSFATTRFCSIWLHMPPSESRPSSLFVMQVQKTRPAVGFL